MNKLYTLIVVTLLMCGTTHAAKWIDITAEYVKNPSFVGNIYTGWEGTPWGSASPHENAEHYQKTFDTYQTLSGLPAGKIRLSCKGFYRSGSSSDDNTHYTGNSASSYKHAKLYGKSSVGEYNVGVALLASGKTSSNLGGSATNIGNWWSQEYVPGNMEAAYFWFNAGYYNNTVTCQVGDDGKLTIGVKKTTTLSSDWACFDDFKIEWYGEEVAVTSVQLSKTTKKLMMGETYQINATILPENATVKKPTYTSSNKAVATVDEDGIVSAISTGTATIQVKCGSVTSTLTVTVERGEIADGSIVINEIMAANGGSVRDASTNFGSWVELYNPTSKAVPLGGLYVSDDPNNLTQHKLIGTYGVLPAHGYALLNYDHFEVWTELSVRQIDDKLSAEGGTIIISDGNKIYAQEDYPAAVIRTSYARTTDGGSKWAFTDTPTPGADNALSQNFIADATLRLAEPEVDKPGQLFTGTMTVTVTIPEGATLRYTTDGTIPTDNNGATSANGIFNISKTTCYRFRLYQKGMLASPVVTRSYIYNGGKYSFPVVSLVTSKNHILEGNMSLFAYSDYGRPGNGQSSKYNGNMAWDRPTNFEYFADGEDIYLSQECDMSACGGWSRAWSPHSFKLKAAKEYELKNTFNHQFFAEKPFGKYKTLQIRNGGNDSSCRFKDAAMQRVIASSGLYVDYQAWQPVHVFINGEHYAVLNMREPNNKDHAYSNYGISDDVIEQFEICADSGYVQMAGTGEMFQKVYNLSKTATSEESYNEICNLVDMDEYTNYMAVQMLLGGTDFPQNNVKGYIKTEEGAMGKFHFVLFDLDFAFNSTTPLTTFAGKQTYTFDKRYGYNYLTGEDITGKQLRKENQFVTLFLNLLKNDTFKKKFADAYCLIAGSVLQEERVQEIINASAAMMEQNGWVNPWNTANSMISSCTNSRQTTMINHLQSYLSLTNGKSVTLSSNVDNAHIAVNDMDVPTGYFSGKLFLPATVKATAPAGYEFLGWAEGGSSQGGTALLQSGAKWKYYDKASLDNTSWYTSKYTASAWSTGSAPLGYGKTQNATNTLTSNKACYYFRNEMQIDNIADYSDFTLDYTVDDGFIIYVNGKEAGRYNMPAGTATYSTVSTSYAQGNPDEGTMSLDKSLFQTGTNLIAVEVHNNNTSSSDILWDCSISARKVGDTSGYNMISTSEEYTMTSTKAQELVAVFGKKEGETVNPVVINEVSADNDIYVNDYFKKDDWVELHNTTSEPINIAGMYLSDNSKKPQKYMIPTDLPATLTTIPAGGYKVVWCSKRDMTETDIHASFKLAKGDGLVMISQYDGDKVVFCDSLRYCDHGITQTVGRYADGSDMVYVMDKPTPGKANILTSYATFVADETATDVNIVDMDDMATKHAEPRKYIDGDRIIIRNNGIKYNAGGQMIGK